MDQREHNFSPTELTLLSELARRMRLFAYVLVASAVISLLLSLYHAYRFAGFTASGMVGFMGSTIVSTSIACVLAFLTLIASGAVQAASRGETQDPSLLMVALAALKRLFAVQYWLIVIGILLVILLIVFAVGAMFMWN